MNTPGMIDIAHSIQLAVAPVFLLSGVGVILTVLTNRLARIIDRARLLEKALVHPDPQAEPGVRTELAGLARRARMVQVAIALSTVCALLVCLVIVSLFAGVALSRDLSPLIIVLFIAGLGAFIGALVVFLLEIRAAIKALRLDPKRPD